ncbi:parathymosin isoform X1 [Pteropus vampyrus]|uniref:Parathymosin isoform X1 n=1 Tax=Pteropus vampyrus TaxID=132908 RepID=A0A6P6CQ85_PTEVA|nr:parathymosin isoform X1 [Pteropus vampyrus]
MWQRNEDNQVARINVAKWEGQAFCVPLKEKRIGCPFRPPIGTNPLSYPQLRSRIDILSQRDLTQKTSIYMESDTQSCTPAPDRITWRHCCLVPAKGGVGRGLESKFEGLDLKEKKEKVEEKASRKERKKEVVEEEENGAEEEEEETAEDGEEEDEGEEEGGEGQGGWAPKNSQDEEEEEDDDEGPALKRAAEEEDEADPKRQKTENGASA